MNDQLILHHNEKEQCIIVVNIFFGVIPLYPVANITAIEPRKIFQKFIFAFFFPMNWFMIKKRFCQQRFH